LIPRHLQRELADDGDGFERTQTQARRRQIS
jgi:hypothetical protein